jgi:hypothetical protein
LVDTTEADTYRKSLVVDNILEGKFLRNIMPVALGSLHVLLAVFPVEWAICPLNIVRTTIE